MKNGIKSSNMFHALWIYLQFVYSMYISDPCNVPELRYIDRFSTSAFGVWRTAFRWEQSKNIASKCVQSVLLLILLFCYFVILLCYVCAVCGVRYAGQIEQCPYNTPAIFLFLLLFFLFFVFCFCFCISFRLICGRKAIVLKTVTGIQLQSIFIVVGY